MGTKFQEVRYEYLYGRALMSRLRKEPILYLPLGCLERHGDHLPVGLDAQKAYAFCCKVAKQWGGLVLPPHHYAGLCRLPEQEVNALTQKWGNCYTNRSAEASLQDIIQQTALMGAKVLFLISGHHPASQIEMIERLARLWNRKVRSFCVIPFTDCYALEGDHAGLSETSLGLYFFPKQVRMQDIGPKNYKEHRWPLGHEPELSTKKEGKKRAQWMLQTLALHTHRLANDKKKCLPLFFKKRLQHYLERERLS